MPYLKLVPTSMRLCVLAAEESDYNVRLLGNLRVGRREKVKLATDEDFNELEGNLSVMEQTSEEPQDNKPIGTIAYCEEMNMPDMRLKANYSLFVHLPKPRFDVLLGAVSRGQMPSEISVDIDGMEYDWQPDGSGKKWDNKTSPRLAIKSITFIVPLIGADPLDFSDDRSPEDGMPPSRAQLTQVTASLNRLTTKLESAHNLLFWLVIMLALLLATIIWRYR